MRGIFSFVLAFLLLSQPALAAPDAKGAASFKNAVEGVLSSWKAGALPGLTTKGDVAVEPEGKFYRARIGGLSIVFRSGFRLDAGDVVIHAAPSTAPGEEGGWVISLALPPVMPMFDAANAHIADVTIGSQRFAAAWSPAIGALTRLDAEYHDVALKMPGDGLYSLSFGALKGRMNMARNADGTWSGLRVFEAVDAAAAAKGRKGEPQASISLRRLVTRTRIDRVSFESLNRAQEKILQLTAPGRPALTPEEMKAAAASVMAEVEALPDGYGADFEATDAAADFVPDPEVNAAALRPQPELHATLAGLKSTVEVAGLRQPKGSLSVRLALDAFAAKGVPPPLDGLVPGTANIDLRFDGLPMQDLVRAFGDIMSAAASNTVDKNKAAAEVQAVLAVLPLKLAAAGTQVSARENYVRAPDLGLGLDGGLAASAASPLLAVGTVTFTMHGLDETIAKYRELGGKNNPELEHYLQAVIPLQLVGQLSKPAGAPSVRTYKIDFTKEGKILLNGVDISVVQALLGASQATSAPPKAP